MAGEENVGSIVFEVGMETTAMLSGGKQVNRVLSEIEASLDASINSFKKMDTQVSATAQAVSQSTRSFGGLQNAMRQGGYQIQDFVVQVQGGQSALVALSQQGSQLLGVFGSGGAVAGALLTIGTVIVGSLIAGMDNAAVSTKALTEAQKRLADIFQVSSNGVVVLSDKFAKLAEVSENAARAQLTMALIDAQNVIKSSVQSVNELGDALGTWKAPLSAAISQMDRLKGKGVDVKSALDELGGTYEGNIAGLNQLNQVVTGVSKAFGISSDDAIKLVQALADVRQNANPDTIAALRDTTVDLSQKYGFANKALSEFTGKVGEYSIKSDQAAESTRLATEMLNGHKVASQGDADAVAQNTKALETYIQMIKDEGATIAFTARQKALYRAEQLGASKEDKDAINTSFDKIEAFKSEQAAKKDAAKETRKAATTAASEAKKSEAQQESVTRKLENLRAQSDLTTESIEKRRIEEAGLRAEQSLGSAATKQQLEEAKAIGEANEKVAISMQKRKEASQGFKQVQSAASPVAGVDNTFQSQMEQLNQYATIYPQKIEEVEAVRAAIEAKYRQERQAAMWDEWAQQNVATQVFADTLQTSMNTVSSSITGILNGTQSLNDALGNIANTVLSSVVQSFVQMGVEWVKSAIMGQTAQVAATTATTSAAVAGTATTTAASVSSAAATTVAWTPAAIVASIGSFGGAAAIGIGAVIAAMALSSSLAGKRKNGGPVSAGSMYQVGEGGMPEIYQASSGKQFMIPGDNGKVISNKDMQSGSGGGLNFVLNITNTNGSRVETSEPQYNNGYLTMEMFIGDMQQGGPMSRSITGTTSATRRATE